LARESGYGGNSPGRDREDSRPGEVHPLDFEHLIEEWGEEPELLSGLLWTFARTAEDDLDTIALALTDDDHARLARTAHRLKGAAGILGAGAIEEQAALLENMGWKGELAEAEACITKLRAEFGRFLDYLHEFPMSSEIP
jgi:HPt (histidine-containing phosphotransfer) domain-containing protein